MFLESSISTSNLPKSSKMYLRRYWRNRQPVLANSPTGIGQFANRYWPIRQPVLTKSSTGIGQFANRYWRIWQYIHINNAYSYCRHAEIANRYWPIRQPVLTNSPTGIGQFTNRYWPKHQPVLAKLPTGIDQIANSFLGSMVGDFVNTGCWFGQYRLAIWSIPVGDFVNTGWRFHNVGDGTYFNKFWWHLWGHLLSIVISQLFIGWRFHFVLKKRCTGQFFIWKKIASWKLNEIHSFLLKQFLQINWKSEEKLLDDFHIQNVVK